MRAAARGGRTDARVRARNRDEIATASHVDRADCRFRWVRGTKSVYASLRSNPSFLKSVNLYSRFEQIKYYFEMTKNWFRTKLHRFTRLYGCTFSFAIKRDRRRKSSDLEISFERWHAKFHFRFCVRVKTLIAARFLLPTSMHRHVKISVSERLAGSWKYRLALKDNLIQPVNTEIVSITFENVHLVGNRLFLPIFSAMNFLNF